MELENQILRELAQEILKEKKRKRRWGIFYKIAFLVAVIILTFAFYSKEKLQQAIATVPHTALVDIKGQIARGKAASADNIVKGLRKAFAAKGTKAVIIRIDSPGGSAVQADYTFQEIRRLRSSHPNIKVYAVCVDMCASAAYYIASAADEIYANESSLVGSIGVIYDGFGFVDSLQKLGVERRVLTAGKNKAFMDPFSPMNDEQKQYMNVILETVHKRFVECVKLGRGDRLKEDPNLFSGLIWSGVDAKRLGLIDGYGSTGSVARDVIKQAKLIDYTPRENFFDNLSRGLTSSLADEMFNQLFATRSERMS